MNPTPLYSMLPGPRVHEDYQNTPKYYIENYLKNNLGYDRKNEITMGFSSRLGVRIDVNTEYTFNNFGFRDKDWTTGSDILAVGCSNTYGFGIPSEGSWPNILQENIKEDVRRLSRAGASIQELVYQLFAYFKIFGNPKKIICLFPDPFRMIVPTKNDLVRVRDQVIDDAFYNVNLDTFENVKISERKKHIKMPFNYEDVLPMEFPLFLSTRSIHMLEQYCASNNIELIWSSWYPPFLDTLNKLEDNSFNNFVYNKKFSVTQDYTDCHKEYRDIFPEYFDKGQDIELGEDWAHPGVHWHAHIAEGFYEEMNK